MTDPLEAKSRNARGQSPKDQGQRASVFQKKKFFAQKSQIFREILGVFLKKKNRYTGRKPPIF